MPIFTLDKNTFSLSELDSHRFKNEGYDKISPQEIIAQFPQLILSVPELETPNFETNFVAREFSTRRGPIDIVVITENADIVLIETKLLRNPESHRTVVAQAIDYAKAFTELDVENIKSQLLKSSNSSYSDGKLVEETFRQDLFCAALDRNIKTGNYKIVIAGDEIHTNILGMVESIQSAPHLAFTVFLVELAPHDLNENNITFHPRVVANTTEIERSVIRLEIDHKSGTHTIESSIPQKERKGSKPTVTPDEYIDSLSKPEFSKPMRQFWKEWENIGGDIRFGTVGLSSRININGTRVSIQYIYDNRIALISDKWRKTCKIEDDTYERYKSSLKDSVPIAYDYLVGNKVEISFDKLNQEDLNGILNAAIEMARELLGGEG